jgi:uncharacterized protein YqeY
MMRVSGSSPTALCPGRAVCNRSVVWGQGAAVAKFASLFNNLFALPTPLQTISFRLFRYWDAIMLRDKLNEAMKDAMRARDVAALGAIRLILAKLKEVDIASRTEANREGVADDKILSMMQGMIKQRNESIVLYEKGNRADLADKEKAEIAVIERFLPQQMDDAAVQAAVSEAIASSGAKSIKDMGGVMAALKARYAGQMDFAKASAVVKKTLAG